MNGAEFRQEGLQEGDGSLPEGSEPVHKAMHQNVYKATLRQFPTFAGQAIKQCNVLISTATGQEAVLSSIEYLSHAMHYLSLYAIPSGPLHKRPNGKNKGPGSSPMLALSTLISEARYTLRLLGLARILGLGLSLNTFSRDLWIGTLTRLQVLMLFMYQVAENIVYLCAKGIISKPLIGRYTRLGRWSLWSARFLLGYFLLQLVKLWRDNILWKCSKDRTCASSEGVADSPKGFCGEGANEKKCQDEPVLKGQEWWKSLVSSSIWTTLCVHWSLERGPGLPDCLFEIFGFVAGAWGLRDMFKEAGKTGNPITE